jgi:UDP-glucose 4-epimerase
VRSGVKRIIFPSSGGAIYGDVKKGFAHEDYVPNPITPYSINKLSIEKYLDYYRRYHNLDYIVYRISNPYGDRQSADGTQGVIPILLRKVLLGEIIDIYGNTTRDYIYVNDVTKLITESFDKKHKYNTYNLGSGEATMLTDILTIIKDLVRVEPKINQFERRKFDVERIVLDISRIRDEFHFAPTVDLKLGIRMTCDAIKQKIKQDQ